MGHLRLPFSAITASGRGIHYPMVVPCPRQACSNKHDCFHQQRLPEQIKEKHEKLKEEMMGKDISLIIATVLICFKSIMLQIFRAHKTIIFYNV